MRDGTDEKDQSTSTKTSDVPDDLGKRIARGAGWMVAMRWSVRLLGLISTIILARLLSPTDFGVVALAMLVVALIEVIGDFGFEQALIQNQNATRRHFDTAWTLNIIRGVLSALILVILAQPTASLLGQPLIIPVIYWLSLMPLLDGLKNVGIVEFRRQLWFGREYQLLVSTKIVSFIVTVGLAFLWQSYWALVVGMVSRSACIFVLSYWMHRYRPRLSMSRVRELFGFSIWILLNHYIHYGNRNFGRMVIARFLDTAALGVFTLAREISGILSSELAQPLIRALFPGYAKAQNDPPRLRQLFLDTAGFMVLLTWPLGFGLAAVAEPFALVVLGQKWLEVAPLVGYLAIAGAISFAWGNPPSLFMAQGRPKYSTLFFAGHFVLMVISVSLGFYLNGMVGIAQGMLSAAVIRFFFAYPFIRWMTGLSLSGFLRVTWRSMVGALIMYVVVLYVGGLVAESPLALTLGIMILAGAVTYPGVVLGLWYVSGKPLGPESILLDYLGISREKRLGGASARAHHHGEV